MKYTYCRKGESHKLKKMGQKWESACLFVDQEGKRVDFLTVFIHCYKVHFWLYRSYEIPTSWTYPPDSYKTKRPRENNSNKIWWVNSSLS